MRIKIGVGYDIHRLVEGRELVLGGVKIPYNKSLLGHSDADVLIHATADAILGAIGQKNIGELFPDSAAWTKDMDSKNILTCAFAMASESGYEISNIDGIIIAQEPKLSPFIDNIRSSLAEILHMQSEDVSIKAKTNERLGEIGDGKAIAALVNVLLAKKN